MASIYDKASLVLIPSGTKTSKVYSQVPTNGDGDFTFSRSTAATRVNASGNIEKETQNLLLQSNQFDTTWGTSGSLTSGQAGYDGTNDAWLFNNDCTTCPLQQYSGNSGVQTFSAYFKKNASYGVRVYIVGTTNRWAFFNLSNGTIHSTSGLIGSNVEQVGTDWYRCSVTYDDTTTYVRFYISDNASSQVLGNITIQDAQLEQGLVARDYIETTTTAIYGGITDNVPRLDYTDSSCPALLLEPQRTNVIAYSEYFGSASWGASNIAITSNATTSPEGIENATTIENTSGSNYLVYTASVSASTTYQFSFYAKNIDATNVDVLFYDASNASIISTIAYEGDLTTEWKRLDFSVSTPVGCTILGVNIAYGLSGSMHIYGAQLEAGSYATSYIPTYGSAVTRNIDNMQIASGISDLLPQGTGTIYVEATIVDAVNTEAYLMRIEQASFSNTIFIARSAAGNLGAYYQNNGSTLFNMQKNNVANTFKAAFAFESGNSVFYVNGELIGTSSVTYTPSVTYDDIRIGGYSASTANMSGLFSQGLVFKTRLSNEELATLTTI